MRILSLLDPPQESQSGDLSTFEHPRSQKKMYSGGNLCFASFAVEVPRDNKSYLYFVFYFFLCCSAGGNFVFSCLKRFWTQPSS
jgi:hypothetical protein